MKVAAYVPIKLNNERLPGKNLKCFSDGTPLCKMIFTTLARVKRIDEKYCFCSSESICEYLPNDIQFLQRSTILDTSQTQCHEIIHAFQQVIHADIIVLCHATSPFLLASSIQKCIDAVLSEKYDSAFTVSRVQEFLWEDGKPLNFDASCAVKTQQLKPVYRETVGCYVFRTDMFLQSNRKVGYKPYLCEVNRYEEIDIDYPEDFEIANAVYSAILKDTKMYV